MEVGWGKKVARSCALSDLRFRSRDRKKSQCFRVRAGVFASAHGRPDGMPGRIIGARAKALPETKGDWWFVTRVAGGVGDLRFESSDRRTVVGTEEFER